MSKKKVSQFEKWFREQFGKLPEDFRDFGQMHDDLRSAKALVHKLEREISWHDRVSTEYRAASYAKNAAQKKFRF